MPKTTHIQAMAILNYMGAFGFRVSCKGDDHEQAYQNFLHAHPTLERLNLPPIRNIIFLTQAPKTIIKQAILFESLVLGQGVMWRRDHPSEQWFECVGKCAFKPVKPGPPPVYQKRKIQ